MAKIDNLISDYGNWLKNNINLSELNDWISISTPFLDNHNDHLRIFVKPLENDKFLLTDDGYIINNLRMSGCNINTPKREEILKIMVNRFGIEIEDEKLLVKTNSNNFPQNKHMLIQAMISINDMFMLAQSKVAKIFLEEIKKFFQENDIYTVPSVKFSGISGFTHSFDFVIPQTNKKPERLLKALNKPTRNKAESALFAWDDVRKIRTKNTKFFVILNDKEKEINENVIEAFNKYDVNTIPWSKRNNYVKKLSA